MLGMLIEVLGLDRIAVQSRFARKGEVALVISLRIARRCRLTPLATLHRSLRAPSFWTLRPWARSMHRLDLRESGYCRRSIHEISNARDDLGRTRRFVQNRHMRPGFEHGCIGIAGVK